MQQSQNAAITPVKDEVVQQFNQQLPTAPVLMGVIGHNEYIALCAEQLAASVSVPKDLTAIGPHEITALDARLQEIQGKLDSAIAKQEQYRKPITEAWTANVLKKFTGSENKVKEVKESVVSSRKAIASEISRRNKISEAEKEKEIAKKGERVNYISSARTYVMSRLSAFAGQRVKALIEKFYEIPAASFDTYIQNLTAWSPRLTDSEFSELCSGFSFEWVFHDLTKEPAPMMTAEEGAALRAEADTVFFQMVNTEKELLQSKTPQRRLELQSGVSGNNQEEIQKQLASFESTATQVAESTAAVIATDAAVDRVEAEFEASAAAPSVQQSSGTSARMIMKPTTHAHWIAIIQRWIAEEYPHCTIDEIAKKFDFALKKGNEMGNITGVWPVDVPTEEDHTVRSARGRKKKED